MDVAWSPHDVWLATCSVDNTIVIWNARKFPGEFTAMFVGVLLFHGIIHGMCIILICQRHSDESPQKCLKPVLFALFCPFLECGGLREGMDEISYLILFVQ